MADFYLGRVVDSASGETTNDRLNYDPDDLTTHGVIVGMTGSGKTGLCLDLMEEAALNNIPALMVDPKGDITNALLHFPDLLPSDFAPWINADDAQRSGKSIDEVATSTANLWRNGLAGWAIGSDRIQRLADAAHFAIYTPGSDAGIPISIVSSLAAPELAWVGNEEILRERISGTVTALLGLIGRTDVDPVRDREHILLANIFEHAWSQGKDLTLGDLIMQVQSPPFEKLGFFDISVFFPDKDRFDLAIQLNNILASPAFQSWIKGEPLDIQRLLYMPDGKPRHTIFYIAHLNDDERMFFVTLFYSAVETWVRSQSGTGSLRALVYFDEIFGYLPPTANPPSKEPMLRLLKQARAFGVGMVLATQNPVDIDYKALSNAGTWFIGKLATDRDKERLLDGLVSAAGGGLDRRDYDKMISGLGKRVFLLRNVHEKHPALFQTRWAMNYLAGPIMRTRIGELNALVGADEPIVQATTAPAPAKQTMAAKPAAAPEPEPEMPTFGTEIRPKIPSRIAEYFLPKTLSLSEAEEADGRRLASDVEHLGIIYHPVLLAQADIRFTNRKYKLDSNVFRTAVVSDPDRRGMVRWEDVLRESSIDHRDLDRAPLEGARFGELALPLSESKMITSMKSDFADWGYRETTVKVLANETLKVYGGDLSAEQFHEICVEAAQEKMDVEMDKLEAKYKRTLDSLDKKLKREERELAEDEDEYSKRKREEAVSHGETLLGMLGIFGRRRSLSGSMSKRRMTAKAKADIEESKEEIERLEDEIETVKRELEEEVEDLREKWLEIAEDVTEIAVQPYKKDVLIDLFGVAWMPHHVVQDRRGMLELPAFA